MHWLVANFVCCLMPGSFISTFFCPLHLSWVTLRYVMVNQAIKRTNRWAERCKNALQIWGELHNLVIIVCGLCMTFSILLSHLLYWLWYEALQGNFRNIFVTVCELLSIIKFFQVYCFNNTVSINFYCIGLEAEFFKKDGNLKTWKREKIFGGTDP